MGIYEQVRKAEELKQAKDPKWSPPDLSKQHQTRGKGSKKKGR